jgi:hypothetical protein
MNIFDKRFTLDGGEELERHLSRICRLVGEGVEGIVPARKLQALLLGGGYGRGEGGVLKTPFLRPTSSVAAKLLPPQKGKTQFVDVPYNDLEFYVFIRGNNVLSERRYQSELNALAERISPEAGLHVEFKIESLERFATAPISMFSYDLMAGNKMILGNQELFAHCAHHLDVENIPLSEATRLLFNRSSGLLLAKERLAHRQITLEDADFIGRNIAKAQLAFGDAVLVLHQQYHWSCRERHKRLLALSTDASPWQNEICEHHAAGLEFKLHPHTASNSAEAFEAQHREVSELALRLWLWIESQRLNQNFSSAREYALSAVQKCSGSSRWRNYFLNYRTFGMRGVFDGFANRYPRERLFNALTLLLWDKDSLRDFEIKRRLRTQLQTRVCDWVGLVAAYKSIWPSYG